MVLESGDHVKSDSLQPCASEAATGSLWEMRSIGADSDLAAFQPCEALTVWRNSHLADVAGAVHASEDFVDAGRRRQRNCLLRVQTED